MPGVRMDESVFGALPCNVNDSASGGGDGGAGEDGSGGDFAATCCRLVIRPELRESGRR
jgi:hypothetical protein